MRHGNPSTTVRHKLSCAVVVDWLGGGTSEPEGQRRWGIFWSRWRYKDYFGYVLRSVHTGRQWLAGTSEKSVIRQVASFDRQTSGQSMSGVEGNHQTLPGFFNVWILFLFTSPAIIVLYSATVFFSYELCWPFSYRTQALPTTYCLITRLNSITVSSTDSACQSLPTSVDRTSRTSTLPRNASQKFSHWWTQLDVNVVMQTLPSPPLHRKILYLLFHVAIEPLADQDHACTLSRSTTIRLSLSLPE